MFVKLANITKKKLKENSKQTKKIIVGVRENKSQAKGSNEGKTNYSVRGYNPRMRNGFLTVIL